MILTTLSAKAYESEMDLYEVLKMIIDRMAQLVSDKAPRITNPVDPGEDFADKWKSDHRLEKHFWEWRSQFQSDLARLASALNADDVQEFARKKLGIQVDDTTGRELASTVQRASLGVAVPRVTFTSSPRPWTRRA
jgi:hypothetical protein